MSQHESERDQRKHEERGNDKLSNVNHALLDLEILYCLGKAESGYRLRKVLRARFGLVGSRKGVSEGISLAVLYPHLRALEKEGLLTEVASPPTAKKNSSKKSRFYKRSAIGSKTLVRWKTELENVAIIVGVIP